MFFEISRLCKDLDENIIIYGIGCYAQDIYGKFCNLLFEQKVKGFVVTGVAEGRYFFNKPVYQISELMDYYIDETILVAVSEKYKVEISKELERLELKKIIYLSDYEYKNNSTWEYYKHKNKSEYMYYIQNWMLNNKYSTMDCCALGQRIEKKDKQIVYIIGMEMALPRHLKIIKALKKHNYEIIVLCYGDIKGKVVGKELSACQIIIKYCSVIEELMCEMLKYNPLLYFIGPAWGDCSWANIVIQQKKMFGKIVITIYDVFNDGLLFASKQQKQMERYALEKADGIVWRWFSKEQLEKQGMEFDGKSIQFLDYCTSDFEIDDEVHLENVHKELKLCFVCGHPDYFFEEYESMAKGYIVNAKIQDILKKIKGKQCCFHLFAWNMGEYAKKKCKELELKYENFRVFMGYEHQDILKRIQEYDYGCFLCTGGEVIPDDMSVDGRYLGITHKDAVSNKFFDYLDAGLPIIATLQRTLCDYLEEYGVLIKMNIDNLDIQYLQKNRYYYKEMVKQAKIELSIERQIPRLIYFFDSVGKYED